MLCSKFIQHMFRRILFAGVFYAKHLYEFSKLLQEDKLEGFNARKNLSDTPASRA